MAIGWSVEEQWPHCAHCLASLFFNKVPKSCPTLCDPWTTACQTHLSSTISQSLLKLMSIELVMLSNHLILCCPLILLPSVFPSIRVFSNESALPIRWPKCWSFSFNISPPDEYSGALKHPRPSISVSAWDARLEARWDGEIYSLAVSVLRSTLHSQHFSQNLEVKATPTVNKPHYQPWKSIMGVS